MIGEKLSRWMLPLPVITSAVAASIPGIDYCNRVPVLTTRDRERERENSKERKKSSSHTKATMFAENVLKWFFTWHAREILFNVYIRTEQGNNALQSQTTNGIHNTQKKVNGWHIKRQWTVYQYDFRCLHLFMASTKYIVIFYFYFNFVDTFYYTRFAFRFVYFVFFGNVCFHRFDAAKSIGYLSFWTDISRYCVSNLFMCLGASIAVFIFQNILE